MSARGKRGQAIWDEVIRELGEFVDTLEAGGVEALTAKYKTTRYQWATVARLRVGLEPAAFAAALGVAPRTLAAWEKGTRTPPAAVALLLRDMADRPKHWKKKLAPVAGHAQG